MNIDTTIILDELTKIKHDYDKDAVEYHVYILYKNDEIVYVGQTKQLLFRIGNHSKTKDFDQFSYISCESYEEMMDIETALILELQPKYNHRVGGSYISVNGFRDKVKEIAGSSYDSSMYINRIIKKLKESDIELVNFKDSILFHKKDMERAIELIMGNGGKPSEQIIN